MERNAGSVVHNGMRPEVRWEEKHNISVQQAAQEACHMEYLGKPTPLI